MRVSVDIAFKVCLKYIFLMYLKYIILLYLKYMICLYLKYIILLHRKQHNDFKSMYRIQNVFLQYLLNRTNEYVRIHYPFAKQINQTLVYMSTLPAYTYFAILLVSSFWHFSKYVWHRYQQSCNSFIFIISFVNFGW